MKNPKTGRFLFVLLLTLGLAGCGRGYEAALVLRELSTGHAKTSGLREESPEASRLAVSYQVEDRNYKGDLYQPAVPAEAAVVVLPGGAEKGKDDPRLVAFATTLARARFSVLVPDLAGLRELRVSPQNIREVADAFSWLVSQNDLAVGGRAGMIAFSYASGPAFLAALEPDIRGRVRFLLAVGGYYDLVSVITFFTTGYYWREGSWHYREPNHYGKWLFVLSNIERIRDTSDRETLRLMARRRLDNPEAGIDDLAKSLRSEGKTIHELVTNRAPARVPELVARLPAPIRADLADLTLAGKPLNRIRARILLVHGIDDDIIPFTESVALSHALQPENVKLFLTGGLFHVDLHPGLLDSWRLWRVVDALLREREMPSSDPPPHRVPPNPSDGNGPWPSVPPFS
jgi:hypothetical protein